MAEEGEKQERDIPHELASIIRVEREKLAMRQRELFTQQKELFTLLDRVATSLERVEYATLLMARIRIAHMTKKSSKAFAKSLDDLLEQLAREIWLGIK